MTADKAIEAVREVRHRISAEFGHDTRALLDHYRKLEKRYQERMLRSPGGERATVQAKKLT